MPSLFGCPVPPTHSLVVFFGHNYIIFVVVAAADLIVLVAIFISVSVVA
jgi:hypothetical protein